MLVVWFLFGFQWTDVKESSPVGKTSLEPRDRARHKATTLHKQLVSPGSS